MEVEETLRELKAAVEILEKQDQLAEDRIKSYNNIQEKFKSGLHSDECSDVITKHAQILCESFVREITCKKEDPNTAALSAALQVLGCCLRNDVFTSKLNNEVCQDLICGLCCLISSMMDKTICKTALWCLSSWKNAPEKVLVETIDVIFSTLETALDVQKSQSLTVEYECMRFIQWLILNHSTCLVKKINQCLSLIFHRLFHNANKIRVVASQCLESIIPLVFQHRDTVIPQFVSLIKSDLHKGIENLFSQGLECFALKIWCILVRIMDKVLHHGSSIINCLLEVVERAFKSQTPEVRISAFMAWKELINNFSKDIDVLSSTKRLKLILEPLKVNNARTDPVIQAKLDVWWHLLISLGDTVSNHFEWVIVPLFSYCFGPMSDMNEKDKMNIRQNLKAGIYDSNSKFASPNLTVKPLLLKKTGCKILGLILGEPAQNANDKISSPRRSSPRKMSFQCDLAPIKCQTLSTPLFFLKHYQAFFQATKYAHTILSESDNKDDHALLQKIWYNVTAHVVNITEIPNGGTNNKTVVHEFLKLVDEVIQGSSNDPIINLKVLNEIIQQLPQKVLTSQMYHIGVTNLMLGTPSSFLINVMFTSSTVGLCNEENENFVRFHEIYVKLLTYTLQSNSSILGFCQSVIQLLSDAAPFITQPDALSKLWSILAENLHTQLNKTQEVNQGDSLTHDFTCLYNTLVYPAKYIFNKANSETATNKSLINVWSTLYKTFCCCASLVITAQTDIWCEQLCSKLNTVTIENSELLENIHFLGYMSKMVTSIMENLHYAELNIAEENLIKSNTTNGLNKRNYQKSKKSKGMKILKSCVELITKIIVAASDAYNSFDLKKVRVKVSIAVIETVFVELTEILSTLIAHITSSTVLYELMFELAAPISLLLSWSKESHTKTIHLWSTITKAFQVYYPGPYNEKILEVFTPLLKVTLLHNSAEIRNNTRLLWHATFGQVTSSSYPEDIKNVLAKTKPPLVLGLDTETQDNSENTISSQDESSVMIPPQIQTKNNSNKQVRSFLKKSPEKSASSKSPSKVPDVNSHSNITDGKSPTAAKHPKTKKILNSSKNLDINDMNTQDFVPIKTPPNKKLILTNHQKEVMMDHRFVPSMYNDLSQDTFTNNSQLYSTDSQDTRFDSDVGSKVASDNTSMKNSTSSNSHSLENLTDSTKENHNSKNEPPTYECADNKDQSNSITDETTVTTVDDNNSLSVISDGISKNNNIDGQKVINDLLKAQSTIKNQQNGVGVMIYPVKSDSGVSQRHVFRVPLNCVEDWKLKTKSSIQLDRMPTELIKKPEIKLEDEPMVIEETPTDQIVANDEFVPSSQGSQSPEKSQKAALLSTPVKKYKQTQIILSPSFKKETKVVTPVKGRRKRPNSETPDSTIAKKDGNKVAKRPRGKPISSPVKNLATQIIAVKGSSKKEQNLSKNVLSATDVDSKESIPEKDILMLEGDKNVKSKLIKSTNKINNKKSPLKTTPKSTIETGTKKRLGEPTGKKVARRTRGSVNSDEVEAVLATNRQVNVNSKSVQNSKSSEEVNSEIFEKTEPENINESAEAKPDGKTKLSYVSEKCTIMNEAKSFPASSPKLAEGIKKKGRKKRVVKTDDEESVEDSAVEGSVDNKPEIESESINSKNEVHNRLSSSQSSDLETLAPNAELSSLQSSSTVNSRKKRKVNKSTSDTNSNSPVTAEPSLDDKMKATILSSDKSETSTPNAVVSTTMESSDQIVSTPLSSEGMVKKKRGRPFKNATNKSVCDSPVVNESTIDQKIEMKNTSKFKDAAKVESKEDAESNAVCLICSTLESVDVPALKDILDSPSSDGVKRRKRRRRSPKYKMSPQKYDSSRKESIVHGIKKNINVDRKNASETETDLSSEGNAAIITTESSELLKEMNIPSSSSSETVALQNTSPSVIQLSSESQCSVLEDFEESNRQLNSNDCDNDNVEGLDSNFSLELDNYALSSPSNSDNDTNVTRIKRKVRKSLRLREAEENEQAWKAKPKLKSMKSDKGSSENPGTPSEKNNEASLNFTRFHDKSEAVNESVEHVDEMEASIEILEDQGNDAEIKKSVSDENVCPTSMDLAEQAETTPLENFDAEICMGKNEKKVLIENVSIQNKLESSNKKPTTQIKNCDITRTDDFITKNSENLDNLVSENVIKIADDQKTIFESVGDSAPAPEEVPSKDDCSYDCAEPPVEVNQLEDDSYSENKQIIAQTVEELVTLAEKVVMKYIAIPSNKTLKQFLAEIRSKKFTDNQEELAVEKGAPTKKLRPRHRKNYVPKKRNLKSVSHKNEKNNVANVDANQMVNLAEKTNILDFSATNSSKQAMPINSVIRTSPMSRAQIILQASLHINGSDHPTSQQKPTHPLSSPVSHKKYFPSPNASPSTSILKKRKAATESHERISSPKSQRHVSFADPPVQVNIEIPATESKQKKVSSVKPVNRCLDLINQDLESNSLALEADSCGSQQLNSEEIMEYDQNQPFFPELMSCKHNVAVILQALTSSMWLRGLEQLLNSQNITTVGEFCALSEMEIISLPIKSPKLYNAKACVSKYYKKIQGTESTSKSAATSVDEKDEVETMPSVEDALNIIDHSKGDKIENKIEKVEDLSSVEDALRLMDQSEDNLNVSIEEETEKEVTLVTASTQTEHSNISKLETISELFASVVKDPNSFQGISCTKFCEWHENCTNLLSKAVRNHLDSLK